MRDLVAPAPKAPNPETRCFLNRVSQVRFLPGALPVSERLGHASVGITLDLYSHVLPSMQQDAVRAFDELPVEVLFDRILRENGISHRHTGVRSPTTTGKIERFHQTLRKEFLADRAFASPEPTPRIGAMLRGKMAGRGDRARRVRLAAHHLLRGEPVDRRAALLRWGSMTVRRLSRALLGAIALVHVLTAWVRP